MTRLFLALIIGVAPLLAASRSTARRERHGTAIQAREYGSTLLNRTSRRRGRRRKLRVAADDLPQTGQITGASTDGHNLYLYTTPDITTNGTFASFGFGANNQVTGEEKVKLTCTSMAFAKGLATTREWTNFGTRQARLPYPAEDYPNVTNNGAATVIAIKLWRTVSRWDSNIVVDVANGLYTGTASTLAASGLVVTNDSVFEYRKTTFKWLYGSGYEKVGPTMTLRAYAGELSSAKEGRPVDCIQFITTGASSGVKVTNLVTEMSLDDSLPDILPTGEFIAHVDTSPFTQGELLRVDAIAMPHIGNTNSWFDTREDVYTMPTHLPSAITNVCDKLGTYAPYIAVVSATGKDATGAATNTTPENVSPAHYFSTIAGALTAIAGTNGTDGGAVVYVKDDTSSWPGGTGSVGRTPDCFVTITNFPGETVRFTTQTGDQDVGDRIKVTGNIYFEGNSSFFSGIDYLWLDGVTISNTSQEIIRNCKVTWITHSTIQRMDQGLRPYGADNTAVLLRGNNLDAFNGDVACFTTVGNVHRNIDYGSNFRVASDFSPGQVVSPEYGLVYNNQFKSMTRTGVAVDIGSNLAITNAFTWLQNVSEIATNAVSSTFNFCSADLLNYTNITIGNSVFVGKRVAGMFYDDSGTGPASWRVLTAGMFSYYDNTGFKTDTHPGEPARDGDRVGNWSVMNQQDWWGNFYAEVNTSGREAPGSFNPEFNGMFSYHPPGSDTNEIGFAHFLNRQSQGAPSVGGNGDYHLREDSPAADLGYVLPYVDRRIVRYDQAGIEFRTDSPIGAFADWADTRVKITGVIRSGRNLQLQISNPEGGAFDIQGSTTLLPGSWTSVLRNQTAATVSVPIADDQMRIFRAGTEQDAK